VTSSPAGISCTAGTCGTAFSSSPITLTATPDATDSFGGWSGGGCSGTGPCTVTLDADKTVTATFGPLVTIAAPADGQVVKSPVTATFSSQTGVSFECAVDPGAFAACTSPASFTFATGGSADGAQVLRVRARDAQGRLGAAAARSFVLDTVGPVITPNPTTVRGVVGAPFTIDFTSNEPGLFLCQYRDFDGSLITQTFCAAAGATSGSFSFTIQRANNQGSVVILGNDMAGNAGSVTVPIIGIIP